MEVVERITSQREHRVNHALWHTMRAELGPEEVQSVLAAYGPSWKNPHRECPIQSRHPYGEDFLFMHRQMMNEVQDALINNVDSQGLAAPLPCIAPWKNIPAPNDRNFPVPDRQAGGVKSDQAYRVMRDWENAFKNRDWLRSHSLGELGHMIEVTLHNNMR